MAEDLAFVSQPTHEELLVTGLMSIVPPVVARRLSAAERTPAPARPAPPASALQDEA